MDEQCNRRSIGEEGQSLMIIPALEDNYMYLLSWDRNALVFDPTDGKKVLSIVEDEELHLTNILVTHHHHDHVAGVEYLKRKTNCDVIGPDDDRVPGLDQSVGDGEELILGSFDIEVLSTPGHTRTHIVYFFRDLHLLFCGDVLFGAGCGKLDESKPHDMWNSLEKIMNLPDETEIYFGHEYTLKDLEFALEVEPSNADVAKRLEEVKKLRAEGKPTTPTTLSLEKKTNPFLRAGTPEMKAALSMADSDSVDVFAHLRSMKDKF